MTPEHFTSLPPWLQVVLSVVAFLGAMWVYMSGLFKQLPQPPVSSEKKADVVVPAVTFTDAKVIESWVEEIRRGNRIDEERSDLAEKTLWILERVERQLGEIVRQLESLSKPDRRRRE